MRFYLTNHRLPYFRPPAECTFGDSRKKHLIQTAFSRRKTRRGFCDDLGCCFLEIRRVNDFLSWKNQQPRLFRNFGPTKFILWFKHCLQRGTPSFKMIMPQSIQLELLKNGTRNILMKLSISSGHHNPQTSTLLSIYGRF